MLTHECKTWKRPPQCLDSENCKQKNGPNNEGLSLFVCLAIDLVWQVSNIPIINVSVFYPDPNHKWLSLAFSYLQGYV